MEYTEAKLALAQCPELEGIDPGTLAFLFWNGDEQRFALGSHIYKEGEAFDGSIFILLEGTLAISQGEAAVGTVSAPMVIGAVAMFGADRKRTATVEAASKTATGLRVALTREQLKTAPLQALEKRLGAKSWAQVVEDQNRRVR